MTSPPVYLKTSDVVPKVLLPLSRPCTTELILNQSWGIKPVVTRDANTGRGELLQSSFDDRDCANMRPQQHGLVGTVLFAFQEHHHLVLRCDKVPFSLGGDCGPYTVQQDCEEVRGAWLHVKNIAVGFCDVELTITATENVKCTIVAGVIALVIEGVTIRPVPGWFMFVKDKDKVAPQNWRKIVVKNRKRQEKMKKRKEIIICSQKRTGKGELNESTKRRITPSLRSVLNAVFCRG